MSVLRGQGVGLPTVKVSFWPGVRNAEADWRLDVMAGSTNCVPLINGYLNADNDFMDDLHADGAVAGFFCYPLDTLREEEGSDRVLQ